MVLVASRKHPRISGPLLEGDVYIEQHAVVSSIVMRHLVSRGMTRRINSRAWLIRGIAYRVLNVVSQTHLVANARAGWRKSLRNRWICKYCRCALKLNSRTCYLSRHDGWRA